VRDIGRGREKLTHNVLARERHAAIFV
jgi:hypothetical protein